ncbi:hypothetical protein [Siminovitchia terrae]|uniref:hypothetical protein n=1 Tax=Siminovitchia terrae TaxID=1914933 RepID=UPI0028ADDB57|nr:hypothetical protein [Siminovitchia terrae]
MVLFHSVGFKPRLNEVKASGGCHRFSEEIYRAKLDKIWAQIGQGAFDICRNYRYRLYTTPFHRLMFCTQLNPCGTHEFSDRYCSYNKAR